MKQENLAKLEAAVDNIECLIRTSNPYRPASIRLGEIMNDLPKVMDDLRAIKRDEAGDPPLNLHKEWGGR